MMSEHNTDEQELDESMLTKEKNLRLCGFILSLCSIVVIIIEIGKVTSAT